MNYKVTANIIILTLACLFEGFSQELVIRADDHFWRKRVVNRISMVEKVNVPLVYHESEFYIANEGFTEKDGIVASLINGVKEGHYMALDPDDPKQTLDWPKLYERMLEFDQALLGDQESGDLDDVDVMDEDDFKLGEEWDEFEAWEEEWEEGSDEFGQDPCEGCEEDMVEEEEPKVIDLGPYEEVIHMVEDWIFDKNTSSMKQRIDFFEIIWVDPTGSIPEKVLARFMWKDVKEQLRRTQWKNRFNDAEVRNMKDVFALRIFNSILVNVSGEPVTSLYESARRKQEIIEFEHHLWNY